MLKDFLETRSNNVRSEDSGVENSVGTCGGEALKDVPRTCWCCSSPVKLSWCLIFVDRAASLTRCCQDCQHKLPRLHTPAQPSPGSA